MEQLEIAHRFVNARFPLAEGIVLGGSTATGTRTASSDIDLLLLGPTAMLDDNDSLAATWSHEGQTVEVFAYSEQGFDRWAALGVDQCRPVIVDMLVHGLIVRDGLLLQTLRARWAPVLAGGPAVDTHRIDALRYAVTSLVDDLRDAHDPFERHTTMASTLEQVAALALLSNGRWLGTGKHLARRLREWSPDRAAALAAPFVAGDAVGFLRAAERELERAGGRLQDGFVR